MKVLLLFIISHILFDFVFQSKKILEKRNSEEKMERLKANIKHGLVHFFGTFVIFGLFNIFIAGIEINTAQLIILIVFVSLAHCLVDLIKSELIYKKIFFKDNIYLFLADQVAHYILIIIICNIKSFYIFIIGLKNREYTVVGFLIENHLTLDWIEKLLLVVIILLIITFSVAVFIKVFFSHKKYTDSLSNIPNTQRKEKTKNSKVKISMGVEYIKNFFKGEKCIDSLSNTINIEQKKNTNNHEESIEKDSNQNEVQREDEISILGAKSGGKIIGILERLFIVMVVTIGELEMIGFVLTAKSIARFKKLDDENFAEIFIIGTFISFMIAILAGFAIKELISQ